jgi:hypothetical protein
MNKFIYSAIALTAASSVSFANGSDWLELDQDIASLTSNVNTAAGVNVGALLRTSFRDGGTTSGFVHDDADLWFEGAVEDISMRVSVALDSGTALVEEAYATWACGSDLNIMWGKFNAPSLRSADIDDEGLLFIDRSLLGDHFRMFDSGASVAGDYEGIAWALGLQNGDDGSGEDHMMFAHVAYHIGAGTGGHDGSLMAGDDLAGTISVGYSDMENDGDDAILTADFAATMGPISGSIELADSGDDGIGGGLGDGTNPLAIAIGYLFADNMEAAFRHEDRDNTADESRLTFGLNYYLHGHNAKWQFNYVDDDAAADEIIAVGLTVGASRD